MYKLISRTSINNQKEGKGIKMTAIANKEKVAISQKREYVFVVEPENQQRLFDRLVAVTEEVMCKLPQPNIL